MRGLPMPREKGAYIVFDTACEAEHLGVPFGPLVFPVGDPVCAIYSLFAWARTLGADTGQRHLGDDRWQAETARHQHEMAHDLGLWGVPSFRLRGGEAPDGPYEDLWVWGQDRLWLIAAEIRRRTAQRG